MVALHDLVNNGEAQSSAIGKAGLEGLKEFVELRFRKPDARVGKYDIDGLRILFLDFGG